jgi:imidazolonepropionase-like amidohydrolase
VLVSTGTDYETDPGHPWPSLHAEMAFLAQRCGIPAAEVIRCATLNGAISMGAQDLLGTVEAGKLADFVVLAADPTADLANLSSIECTVKRGHRFDRADFRKGDQ